MAERVSEELDSGATSRTPVGDAALERVVKRDRLAVGIGTVLVAALAWTHIVRMAQHDGMSAAMVMPHMREWSAPDLPILIAMWAVMMIAMMLPSAAPFVLLFAAVTRRRRERRSPAAPTSALAAGYLAAWTAFSIAAALAQWKLHQTALLSPAMTIASPVFGGVLLIAAGAYQWTPFKGRCLSECRSPLGFISREWREGSGGAFVMGARHGAFCVGCCWVLMALLFVAGVMNLLWVAALALFVLVEKVAPAGGRVGKAAGALLVMWGSWMLAAGG